MLMERQMLSIIFNPGYTECENKNELVNRRAGKQMNVDVH